MKKVQGFTMKIRQGRLTLNTYIFLFSLICKVIYQKHTLNNYVSSFLYFFLINTTY